MGHITQCGILFMAVAVVSAQNKTCLPYLAPCPGGSTNCCNDPIVMCLPDNNNGTSCLNMFDIVNLSSNVTGLNFIQPFLHNTTGFLSESINVDGKNVYNATETFTSKPENQ